MEVRTDDTNRRTLLMVVMTITLFCIICSSMALIAAILARRQEAALAAQSPAGQPDEAALIVVTEPPLVQSPATTKALATASPSPADAATLQATATPAVLKGKGDEKVDVERGHEPSIAHISHSGSGHFSVINYNSDGKRIGLLVNTTGRYDGVVPIDFMVGEHTARFRVEADGEWTIELLDLLAARAEYIPGIIEGSGDEVVVLNGGSPSAATVEATGNGSFALWSYGSSYDLVVSESAPYRGSVVLDPHAFFLVISADAPWSLSITAGE